jgi:hypothetical protein
MTQKRGSWDDTRLAVWTAVPTVLILFIGGMMVFRDWHVDTGIALLWVGVGFTAIEILDTTIAIFKKHKGCDGCPYNTEDKFLRQFEKK